MADVKRFMFLLILSCGYGCGGGEGEGGGDTWQAEAHAEEHCPLPENFSLRFTYCCWMILL